MITVKTEIIRALHDLERQYDIDIIYACESGSRVWGFSNDESDYDVRFIYRKRNVQDYLTLRQTRDVIEFQKGDLDIVGWDIKKALIMHYKNNPNLREWLISNQKYIDNGAMSIFYGLVGFNLDTLKNHYFSIALKHWKKYSGLEISKTKIKKYLYVIRSILCWNLLNRDIYPPINIWELLDHDYINLHDDIHDAIIKLIDYHQGNGKISENVMLTLTNYIIDSLKRMKKVKTVSFKNIKDYDERFRELLFVR